MLEAQFLKNLQPPCRPVDVVLDTDAFNEIDDQFAIAYMLRAPERLRVKGICAAPFFNSKSSSPQDGMEKSYQEIFKILGLAGVDELNDRVYKGSVSYLPDEKTPVASAAATFMAQLADRYTPEDPLYIVALGAITNVASAFLLNPSMKEKTVVVWLGGTGHHWCGSREFNLRQDIAAARVVFDSGVPLVQLPCQGVVDHFTTSRYELEHWLAGKNPLAGYLAQNAINEAESYAAGKPWTRVIWDVTAVAWLLDDEERFFSSDLRPTPIPEYDHTYTTDSARHLMRYITHVKRDALFEDLFRRLTL